MAKKEKEKSKKNDLPNAYIDGAGIVFEEGITKTLEKNYMPYAMSVNVSRAFPEIDGFKPSHRKLLFTMYKMGLLTGAKTKSANVVGQTMKLNPHGDGAIYETMVRLTRGNESLLHAYIDSKGNFGKSYSRDMAYAASRYTEVKLDMICNELFRDIDKDTVDFVPNYDNKMMEPTLLPATYPSILVNSNVGIGVSIASSVASFNLGEICETAISILRDPETDLLQTLKGPDFAGGGYIVYNEADMRQIYQTGRGSVKIRSKYSYDKEANCIEVVQIPPTTTIEAIIEKIVTLVKLGKIREISYIRDETDKNGLKIAIDLKRGVDHEKLMAKLFKFTPLEDNYSCNFNILVNGYPKVMGVKEILEEWIEFRLNCTKRRINFELKKKADKLRLLRGLEKILLDIDKAIKIVRETTEESEVVPNLMIGFSIDEVQAEYVADIKLRNLNKEYILKRIEEISALEKDIEEMKEILSSERKQLLIIINELKEVIKKYAQPRKTLFVYQDEVESDFEEDDTPDYNVNLFLTKSGYFKKITPQSLRMSGEQKLKEGDSIYLQGEATNKTELLFFSDKVQVYKSKVSEFDDSKASLLGDYIPAKLSFDEGESVKNMLQTKDYKGFIIFVYQNGKVAKVPLSAYETKTNRKKLIGAYSDKCPLVEIFHINDNVDILLRSSNGKAVLFNTAALLPKTTKNTIGVSVMTLRAKSLLEKAFVINEDNLEEFEKFRTKTIPAVGSIAKNVTDPDQLTF